jgi:hypothetical protein
MTEILLTPRIEACLAAGNIDNLFPVLAGWNDSELRALAQELKASYRAMQANLEEAYHDALLRPEYFFTRGGQQLIDHAYRLSKFDLLEIYSEIQSVIEFYLNREKAESMQ